MIKVIVPGKNGTVITTLAGCQVGGHVQKGGKEDIFTGKGGQKEDIFY